MVAIENEVKTFLARGYGQVVSEQAVFGSDGRRYIFDAIIKGNGIDWFVEIKELNQNAEIRKVAVGAFERFKHYHAAIASNIKTNCGFVLVIVTQASTKTQRNEIKRKLLSMSEALSFLVRVEVLDEEELLPT